MGDISEQVKLKKEKNCKSFDWFMKEIAYDVFDKYPRLPPNKHWGELKNEASSNFNVRLQYYNFMFQCPE